MTWKVMQRNSWKDIVNSRTKRLNEYTKSQLHVLTTFNSRRNRICWRIVKSVRTICFEMRVSSSNWETWCFMVCKQAWSCHHEMDQSMWQTFSAFDLLHSSHKWLPTIIVMRETQHNNADQDYFKTLILQEISKTQNQRRAESYAFSEATRSCQ